MSDQNHLRTSAEVERATLDLLEELHKSINSMVYTLLTTTPEATGVTQALAERNRRLLLEKAILPVWRVITDIVNGQRTKPPWYPDLKYRIDTVTNLYVVKADK